MVKNHVIHNVMNLIIFNKKFEIKNDKEEERKKDYSIIILECIIRNKLYIPIIYNLLYIYVCFYMFYI